MYSEWEYYFIWDFMFISNTIGITKNDKVFWGVKNLVCSSMKHTLKIQIDPWGTIYFFGLYPGDTFAWTCSEPKNYMVFAITSACYCLTPIFLYIRQVHWGLFFGKKKKEKINFLWFLFRFFSKFVPYATRFLIYAQLQIKISSLKCTFSNK